MTDRLLNVREVSKRFGGLIAVDGISFEVAEHQVLGLIGPNGSGKTTMLNLISGALRPSGGAIELRGQAIAGLPPRRISRLGVGRTFQLVRLLPSLSVLDNVIAGAAFGHRRRWGAEARRHAEALLERVGLAVAPDAAVGTLTYIDQKRLELARTLAGDPVLLLLDEWLAGLNPTELATGVALIDSLRAEGRTIILVEHVMDAIRSLCDTCVVMSSGSRIAQGPPEAVLADPAVVRAYLGDDGA
ncbi:MAG: ABC transporter ATP-binding protein [Alphaproteobacteria bacterium]